MRVAVISDTHLHEPSPWFKKVFEEHCAPCDAVIHCGDIVGPAMWRFLEASHPEVYGVSGNMCLSALQLRLPPRLDLDLGGLRVAVTHGQNRGPARVLPDLLAREFAGQCDLLCFGHRHEPFWDRREEIWLLNPGSLQQHAPCMAVLTLDPDTPGAEPAVEHLRP